MDSIVYDFKGMVTAPGQLARAPASCLDAPNVVFEAPGVARMRRGYLRQSNGFGGPIWKMASNRTLGSSLLVNYGTAANATALRYGDGTAAYNSVTAIGSVAVTNTATYRMMSAEGLKNLYLTSAEGLRRLETDYTLYGAGMPPGLGLDLRSATVLTGTPGAVLADGWACAYRVVWCRKDQQGVEMCGPPSSRTVVRNATGTSGWVSTEAKNVVTRVPLPKAVLTNTALTTSYYWRLYRTRAFQISVGPPDEEFFLVYEAFLTSTDIGNGYASTVDITPDTLLGPPLNTNPNSGDVGPNGERGVVNSDDSPPMAREVAYWSDCLWCADTASLPYQLVTMLSVPADGDTITIDGTVYTFRNAPATSTEVQISAHVGTLAQVEQTTINLCAVVNKYSGNTTVGAWYVSGPTAGSSLAQLPGQFVVQARTLTAFSTSASVAANWRGLGVNSQDVASNTLSFSKPFRPDAMPLVNRFSVGPSGARILRLTPYKDRLLVWTDYGLYQVTGNTAGDFTLTEFDLTYHLIIRESVSACDDRVYGWCAEGIVEVDTGGVRVVSIAIEPTADLIRKTVTTSVLADYAFGFAYAVEHKVLFFYPQDSTTTDNKQSNLWLTFDTRTRCWSGASYVAARSVGSYWDGRSCGVVRWQDDVAFLGNWNSTGADAFVYQERKTLTAADYQDSDNLGNAVQVAARLTLNYRFPQPGVAVHWQELQVEWENSDVLGLGYQSGPGTAVFTTNLSTASVVNPAPTAGVTRLMIPREARRADRLRVQLSSDGVAGSYFGVMGLVLRCEPGSGRTVRA